jgi:hypothetical protein
VYKLGFYVPLSHLETVKASCFEAGAGRAGNYEQCCWQALGEGQFRPMPESEPFIGTRGELEKVPEYRVEMVCGASVVRAVVDAMRLAHPYETPAWDLVALITELP